MSRTDPPFLCAEAPTEYHASVLAGSTNVPLLLHAINGVAGARVLVDGQVTGAPLAGAGPDFAWTLPSAPGVSTTLALQILSATGMQSNAVALPVVSPPVAAVEPLGVQASTGPFELQWPDQFGITGPGTQYDVFSGTAADLATVGFSAGNCLTPASVTDPLLPDARIPTSGQIFYYVVRAQNQVNVTTWGTATRDTSISASLADCSVLFP